MGLTAALGAFVAGLDPSDVPASARLAVRRGIVDAVGVLYAGRDEPVVGHALSMVQQQPTGEVRVLAGNGFAPAPDAAMVDATAAHALDYDDTGIDGHPSVVLGPAALAEGAVAGARWIDLIAGYVAGYETWAELSARDADRHHGKGWHPTAVFGTVAAAAAAARLRRLDPQQAAHALGLAASMAAGLVSNFGSMAKPLQVGFAVRNGLHAARLAQRGVTASADALESPRGFLAAVSPRGHVDLDRPMRAGAPWQIVEQGLNIKRYPVCYAMHRAVDAALALRPSLEGRFDSIERIDIKLGELQAAMLRSSRPTTGLDARFSVEFAMACALIDGRLGLAELDDGSVMRPEVQALLRRVRVETDAARDPDDPLFSPADRLRVVLRDGSALEAEPVKRASGHASHPLGEEALAAKFAACGGPPAWWHEVMRTSDDARYAVPGMP